MAIMNSVIDVVIRAFLLASVACGQKALFVGDERNEHLTCSANAIFTVDDVNVIKCAIFCEMESFCSGYAFRETGGNCIGCSGGDASIDTVDMGIKYFLSHSPKWGQTCRPGLVCSGDNQGCLDGVCVCSQGYSFQATTRSCQAGCSEYGDTFQRYKGVRLVGNNIVELRNYTLSDCIDACLASTSPSCVSFEFSADLGECNLNPITLIDDPEAYEGIDQYDYYNRNC